MDAFERPIDRIDSYIAGSFVALPDVALSEKVDPRTGRRLRHVAQGGVVELDQAADAAQRAFEEWRDVRPSERGRILVELGRVIRAHGAYLGRLESEETGKPAHEMPALIDLTAQFFEFYGGIVNVVDGDVIAQGPDYHVYTRRDPFGVIGVILPWNAPLHQAARAIAPALAAGNAVVAKPSEHTPSSLVELARLAVEEAGLPAGLFNVVLGRGTVIGPAMVAHPSIQKISLTGSVRAGQELGRLAADRIMPLTLELGGKSANIIFNDADLDAAASGSVRAFTWNSGQWCAVGTRLLVQEDVHDQFVARFVANVAALNVGPEANATSGPITTRAQYEKIQSYFEIAEAEGLTCAMGGKTLRGGKYGDGWFIAPTVYTGVTNDSVLAREEIFGPVVVVIPFRDGDTPRRGDPDRQGRDPGGTAVAARLGGAR